MTGVKPGLDGTCSPLGVILVRKLSADNEYDLHITFRGSRAGKWGMTGALGMDNNLHNADWVRA